MAHDPRAPHDTTPDEFLAIAHEIRHLQEDMCHEVDQGRDIADSDFHDRYTILTHQFAECMREAGIRRVPQR